MHLDKSVRTRFIRLVVSALLMLTVSLVVWEYAPRRVVLVPCIFMALIGPMVLLPLKPKAKV